MLDAEIYVDRIADMRIHDMNAVLEAVRHMVLAKHKGEDEDLHLRTLAVAQIQEEEYFGHVASKDLSAILLVTWMDILKLSNHMDSPISQQGNATLTHGKGKRKRR